MCEAVGYLIMVKHGSTFISTCGTLHVIPAAFNKSGDKRVINKISVKGCGNTGIKGHYVLDGSK